MNPIKNSSSISVLLERENKRWTRYRHTHSSLIMFNSYHVYEEHIFSSSLRYDYGKNMIIFWGQPKLLDNLFLSWKRLYRLSDISYDNNTKKVKIEYHFYRKNVIYQINIYHKCDNKPFHASNWCKYVVFSERDDLVSLWNNKKKKNTEVSHFNQPDIQSRW